MPPEREEHVENIQGSRSRHPLLLAGFGDFKELVIELYNAVPEQENGAGDKETLFEGLKIHVQ